MIEHNHVGLPQGQYSSYQINNGQPHVAGPHGQFMGHSAQYHPTTYFFPPYNPGYLGQQPAPGPEMPTDGPNPADNVFSAHYSGTPAPPAPSTRGSSTLSESAPPIPLASTTRSATSSLSGLTGPSESDSATTSKSAPITDPIVRSTGLGSGFSHAHQVRVTATARF